MCLVKLYKNCRMRVLVCAALTAVVAGCGGTGQPFEYIHLPGTEPAAGANMPFTSAIQVRSGNMLFLAGTVGAPSPHSHPHIPAEFDHLDFGAEASTIRVMESIKAMVEAAGGEITDVIQVTKFVKDVGSNGDAIREVMNRYWGPSHRPASTTVEIVRLATDPRFILEVEAIAVLPD
jgi:enamine deaminase RidA (YjgF/YER057c/UK114 family)